MTEVIALMIALITRVIALTGNSIVALTALRMPVRIACQIVWIEKVTGSIVASTTKAIGWTDDWIKRAIVLIAVWTGKVIALIGSTTDASIGAGKLSRYEGAIIADGLGVRPRFLFFRLENIRPAPSELIGFMFLELEYPIVQPCIDFDSLIQG